MTTNLDRWDRAKFTRSTQIEKQAAKIRSVKSRYETVAAKTGVPWDVIAVIHYRESSGSFAGVLHNGQKIIGKGTKTTIVPKGRGPFSTWEEAAVDALMKCHPYLGRNTDWSLATTLDKLEAYNGLGYRKKGLPSPYLWAGTDQYESGKYVADGKFSASTVDSQLGVAALLIALRGQGVEKPAQEPQEALKPVPAPSQPPKAETPSVKSPERISAGTKKAGGAGIVILGVVYFWQSIAAWAGSAWAAFGEWMHEMLHLPWW